MKPLEPGTAPLHPAIRQWAGPFLMGLLCFLLATRFGDSRTHSVALAAKNGPAPVNSRSVAPDTLVPRSGVLGDFDHLSIAQLESAIEEFQNSAAIANPVEFDAVKAAFRRYRQLSGLAAALHRVSQFAAAPAEAGDANGELPEAALLGLFQGAVPSQEELLTLLPGTPPADALRLIDAYCTCAQPLGFTAAQKLAEQFWLATGQPLDDAIRAQLRRSLYAVFTARGDIEQLLKSAQEIQDKTDRTTRARAFCFSSAALTTSRVCRDRLFQA